MRLKYLLFQGHQIEYPMATSLFELVTFKKKRKFSMHAELAQKYEILASTEYLSRLINSSTVYVYICRVPGIQLTGIATEWCMLRCNVTDIKLWT